METRTETITIRVTESEKDQLKWAAALNRQTVSGYAVKVLGEFVAKEKARIDEFKRLSNEL